MAELERLKDCFEEHFKKMIGTRLKAAADKSLYKLACTLTGKTRVAILSLFSRFLKKQVEWAQSKVKWLNAWADQKCLSYMEKCFTYNFLQFRRYRKI